MMGVVTTVLPPLLVMLGSIGMILFASKFPFTTSIKDLKSVSKRILFLNGYHLWILSWIFMIAGAAIQLCDAIYVLNL